MSGPVPREKTLYPLMCKDFRRDKNKWNNYFPYIQNGLLRSKRSAKHTRVRNIRKTCSACALFPPGMDGVTMREKQIEQKLAAAVKTAGGIAPKFISPGYDGMPDRLLLFPGGQMAFVEVKATGKHPRPLQTARHEMLRRLGYRVYVLDRPEQIGAIIEEVTGNAIQAP